MSSTRRLLGRPEKRKAVTKTIKGIDIYCTFETVWLSNIAVSEVKVFVRGQHLASISAQNFTGHTKAI